jgi:iron complex outermembrane receptor protein
MHMSVPTLRRLLAALPLIAAAALPARAAAAPEPAPPITGVVVDSSGAPLANASVAIGALGRAVTTAADGTFSLRSVPAGTYHLDVSLLGYAPAHAEVTVPATGTVEALRVVLRATALSLQGLVVTGTPNAADPLRVTQSVTEVSGKRLDRNLGSTVAQTLAQEPGIDTRYNGPAAATPVIRGLSGDRVLVLQNGERAGDLSGAAPDHGLSIDPLAATRLEVVRGPASLLYGSGAVGGVVNVIENDIPTSVPARASGYVAAQGESVNPGGGATVEVTAPLGPSLALVARGGGRRVDDVRVGGGDVLDNTFLHNYHGDVGLGYVGERASVGAAYSGYGFNYGLPAPPGDAEAGTHIRGHRHQGKAQLLFPLANAGWISDLKLNGTAQWYAHDEVEASGDVATSFNLRTQTANLQGRTRFGGVNGAIGVSGLFREYVSTGEEALTPAANTANGGVFAFQEIPLGPSEERSPRLQLGVRYDRYHIQSKDGGATFGPGKTIDLNAFSGSAGLNVPLTPEVSVGASVARAFRAPTVEELFSNAFHAAAGTFDVGNPNLKPEINNGVEGVVRAQGRRVTADVSAYYNRISGYIVPFVNDSVDIDDEGETVRVGRAVYEQADANLRGVEARAELVVAPHFVVGGMGDYVRGTFVDGGNIPFMPPARLGGLVRWDDGKASAEASYRHAFAQNDVAENETATDSYDLLNLSLGYSRTLMGRVNNFTLRVDNVLDEKYRDATSRIKDFTFNPGRNVSLVYKLFF